ncbi:MAG: tetratricopeptide repeat protein [Candidatus Delongbacteria bacterium]|nr:tetratricopeptide repeat protein [Candidatus Delongbacteria bacterium]
MKKKVIIIISIAILLFFAFKGFQIYVGDKTEALYNEGYEKLVNKEYAAAIDDFNSSLYLAENIGSKIFPEEPVRKLRSWAYAQKAWCYKQLNEYETAIEDFNKAEEIGFNKPDLYKNRGYVYDVLWDYEASLQDYKKLIELEPDSTFGYWKAAGSLMQLEKYDESLPYLDKVIELDPENVMSYFYIGHVNLYGYEDYIKAEEFYSRAIEISKAQNKEYNYYYYFRGKAKKELNKLEEANIDFKKAISIAPLEFDAGYYFRGLSYYNLEDYKAAISDFEKEIEINPNYKYPYNSLGDTFKELKQNEKAAEYYNKYLSLIEDEEEITEVKEKLKEMGY